jgi:hypothetical protein
MGDSGKAPGSANNVAALGEVAKNMNWPTVLLILVTGGGNWFANQANTSQVRADQLHAYNQIQDLHNNLDDFEKRQKTMLSNLETSLDNQRKMIETQNATLSEIRSFHKDQQQEH